jgi:hypothetical protein
LLIKIFICVILNIYVKISLIIQLRRLLFWSKLDPSAKIANFSDFPGPAVAAWRGLRSRPGRETKKPGEPFPGSPGG